MRRCLLSEATLQSPHMGAQRNLLLHVQVSCEEGFH